MPISSTHAIRARRTVRRHVTFFSAAAAAVLALPAFAPAQDKPLREPDVIYVPTPTAVVEAMLDVAKVGKDDRLYDLGSGDGRIVVTAAKKFGTRGTGIDIDPQRIAESNENAKNANVTNLVEFRNADLFETDLRDASVITLYLLPELNVKLRPKLFEELKPGTRIVSHAFDMRDWEPDSTLNINGSRVYYWIIPAKVEGTWDVTLSNAPAGRTYSAILTQHFQHVSGDVASGTNNMPLLNPRLTGNKITFGIKEALDGNTTEYTFEGTVNGNKVEGTYTVAGDKTTYKWSATKQ